MSSDVLLNPAPCDDGLLAEMTALAGQIGSPLPPFPVFNSSGQCGGGGGSTTGSAFPLYFFPSDCSSSSIPTYQNNCLRVINDFDGTFDPYHGPPLDPTVVNVLPGGTDEKGSAANNIFPNNDERLYSWYCPPQYEIIFFKLNPMTNTREVATAGGYLRSGPNFLQVDACLSDVRLSDNSQFFKYGSGSPAVPSCLQAYCACGTGATYPAGPSYCQVAAGAVACPGVTHNAPYFIVIHRQDFSDIIREMCVDNRQVDIGPDTPQNSLNKVWKPQAGGCDTFITNLCNISDVDNSPYKEMCACYTQQQALNNQYGASLNVPVCCFGQDPSGDIKKSCAFDEKAYKTGAMLRNCCSFAECQTIVNESQPMQAQASPPGEINCQGSFVQFPAVPVTPTGPLPTIIITDSSNIPFYVWLIFGLSILLLILFVIVLSFV